MSPDGSERRKNNRDVDIAVMGQKLDDFMEKTKDYRIVLFKKIDDLEKKVNAFPCDIRKGWMDNMSLQAAGLWCAMIMIFGTIVAQWAKSK